MRPKKSIHVTAAVLAKAGKYLITQRPEGSHLAGMWEFPGGKKEAGESLEMCLEREIREELGVDIRVGRPILTVRHEYDRMRVTLHFFRCTHVSGSPQALNGQEIRWVHPAELRKYTFPPPDTKIIEHLVSQDRHRS